MTRVLAAALLGCSASSPPVVTVAAPTATSTQQQQQQVAQRSPGLTPRAFLDAGCVQKSAIELDCSKSTIEGADECLWPLQRVDVTFDPPAFVAECEVETSTPGLRMTGCMHATNVVLFASTKSGIVRIATPKDLAATFAPVTTPEEAIAFARVLTGASPYVKADKADDGTPMITHPMRVDSDFELSLFQYRLCGCEHPVTALDYRVSRDGGVTELKRAVAQQNATETGLCRD